LADATGYEPGFSTTTYVNKEPFIIHRNFGFLLYTTEAATSDGCMEARTSLRMLPKVFGLAVADQIRNLI
jgi:hypothetical protein